MDNKVILSTKMQSIDWDNLEEVKKWYKENRGLDLKNSSVVKMLLADKVYEISLQKERRNDHLTMEMADKFL